MKILKNLLSRSILLCLALCLVAGFAACQQQNEDNTSTSLPPEENSSAVSATPEPESSHFVPAPDLISTPSGIEEGTFEYAFSQNPIDKKYDADYSLASSLSMMRQACNQAARNWKNMVDVAYAAALEVTPEDDQSALVQQQTEWEMDLDSRIEEIREEAGDSNEGILTSARQVVLLYRDRAMTLCRIKYEADGALPDFPDLTETSSVAG
ncbi:hypothetical protein [uncultured Neglectibacter sp.]|uniref:hypothetical protein n=1 Tax=uncultured Neglectibacter sp. TaxID=1924108 RepID=UPI0034DF305D